MLYLTQRISQDNKTHPTIVFFHVALTSSYLDISQACFDTFILMLMGYHVTHILCDSLSSILIGYWVHGYL